MPWSWPVIAAMMLTASHASAELSLQSNGQPQRCDRAPVYMVVSGVTRDRARMAAYTKALLASGLYAKLGGYYINFPQPLETFEGELPAGHASLIVRFPCLANARAFWNSPTYQKTIRPMRLHPSAGDYTVAVYPEAPPPPYMSGRIERGGYVSSLDEPAVEPELRNR